MVPDPGLTAAGRSHEAECGASASGWRRLLPWSFPAWLPEIVFLCLCTWLFAADLSANGHPWGFPLDDAWIHMTFGRNLAQGAGFGVNPGEPSGASTSVLWSLWLAALHLLPARLGLAGVIACVKASGVLLGLAALAGTRRFLRAAGLSPGETFAGLLLAIAAYPLSWAALSGMEVPLACALCAWATAYQAEASREANFGRSRRIAAVLWTLATLARPENVVFLAAAVVLMSRTEEQGRLSCMARLAGWVFPVLVVYICIMIYISGKPWPSTLEAKMTAGALPALARAGDWAGIPGAALAGCAKSFGESMTFLLGENVVALAAFLLAPLFWFVSRKERFERGIVETAWFAWASLPVQAGLVAMVAAPESYSAFHGRYLAHTVWLAVPAAMVFACVALRGLGRPRLIICAVVLVGLLAAADRQIDLAGSYALETSNITNLQVRIARWFGERLPKGGAVAINDVGAMGYFSGRRLIDLEGLITPQAIPWNRAGRIDAFLEGVKPEYLLIFPYWYPEVVGRLGFFKPLMRFSIERNVTGGGEEMVLFAMPWTSVNMQAWPPLPEPGLPPAVPLVAGRQ
ncbi:hypothetical protein KBA41_01540 [Candidatus Ozemobacteraceae bacterium]|nr:hypothetical protein [Candidatus Ozemobacteraceae bacterium]